MGSGGKVIVIVIGAGAGGLMAAGRAAEGGAKVVLLERGPRTARKLRIAGKGRANITNTAELADFVAAFGENGKFLYGAFSRFFRDDLVGLLRRLGVETKVERGGRVFPASDDADEVADALERWVSGLGVEIRFNTKARKIIVENGVAVGVETYSASIRGDAIILATGGITYPRTGSTGDGYRMAAELGHWVVEPRPALTAMVAAETWVRELQGLSLRNVEAKLYRVDASGKQRLLSEEFGEMLFTHFGVSGPIILTLSRKSAGQAQGPAPTSVVRDSTPDAQRPMSDSPAPGPRPPTPGKLELSVDLKPALSDEQLDRRLIRDFVGARRFKNYLSDLLPRTLIPIFIRLSGVPKDLPVGRITAVQRKRIMEVLRDLRLTITGLRPPDEAIVTAGGVDIGEIDPRTMESKIVRNLYFVGEVIDIDAATGGYNLQAAFSTGWVAGESAAAA